MKSKNKIIGFQYTIKNNKINNFKNLSLIFFEKY